MANSWLGFATSWPSLWKFLIGWECGECAANSSPSSLTQRADLSTNDRNNGVSSKALSVFPLKKIWRAELKGGKKRKYGSLRECPQSVVLFVHSSLLLAHLLLMLLRENKKNAQGSFTTTTQAPALPMLRWTSYRKTERLTCSFAWKTQFKKRSLHLQIRRLDCQDWVGN